MFDMTCKEFDFYSSTEMRSGLLSSEAAMHVEQCKACREMWHREQELARRFQDLRESASHPSPQVEVAVMAAYRKKFTAKTDRGNRRRVAALKPIVWMGLAATLVVGALLLSRQNSEPTTDNVTWNPPRIAAPPLKIEVRPTTATVKKPHRPHTAKGNSAPPVMEARDSTAGFQSLMYCDELSCSGPMDVIRIELPAPAMTRVPTWQRRNGFVQADVVVGSDGIARAIRIVK
jgi:hypothetical protein